MMHPLFLHQIQRWRRRIALAKHHGWREKTLAKYFSKKVADLPATGPQDSKLTDMAIFVEEIASIIYLGQPQRQRIACPQTAICIFLAVHCSSALWQDESIREPQDQTLASKGYIYRNVNEVIVEFNLIFYLLQSYFFFHIVAARDSQRFSLEAGSV